MKAWFRWLFNVRVTLPAPHWSTVVHAVGGRRYAAGAAR